MRVLLLECLWRGEIEKKRWSPARRHKRTRTRTRATSSHLVSPAQPSTIFVPRIEVSREPFPCPVATRAIAVRPRSVEKTELFWHSPRIFFLFSNRRGAPPRRAVAARKLPPRASSVRRLGPDVSSLPSRGIRDRAPGVDETRTHLGSGSGRKGSKLVGARLLNNTRALGSIATAPSRDRSNTSIDRWCTRSKHTRNVLRAHLHRRHHRGPHAPAPRRLRQPPAGAPPLPLHGRRARHAEPESDPQRATPPLPALHHRAQHTSPPPRRPNHHQVEVRERVGAARSRSRRRVRVL